ncbi:MAG: hypothetical protein ACRD6N_19780, partial [Pyrinomonadaceae bacterium]
SRVLHIKQKEVMTMTQILLSTSSRSGLLKLLFTLSAVSIIVGVTTVNGAPQGDDRVIQQAQDAVREKIWREQMKDKKRSTNSHEMTLNISCWFV